MKVKEIVILDISKRAAERQQQVAEFVKLHEIVKNERNKYAKAPFLRYFFVTFGQVHELDSDFGTERCGDAREARHSPK